MSLDLALLAAVVKQSLAPIHGHRHPAFTGDVFEWNLLAENLVQRANRSGLRATPRNSFLRPPLLHSTLPQRASARRN
jgi:hypothetical protein